MHRLADATAGAAGYLVSILPVSKIAASLPNIQKEKKWSPEGVTLIALGALMSFLPEDTKIHWEEYSINFHIPNQETSQALDRFLSNDSRTDLEKFCSGVELALELFPPPKIEYPDNVEEQNNDTFDYSKLHPLTHLWYSFVEGLIAQQRTYNYNQDKNISLTKKPDKKDLGITAEDLLKWRTSNKLKSENDQKASAALHGSILSILQALLEGRDPKEDLSPLATKVKNNYTELDFKYINQQILELRGNIKERPPREYKCQDTVEIVKAICKKKIGDYSKFRKEAKEMQTT